MSAYRMSDTSNKVSNCNTPSPGMAALQTNGPSTRSGWLPPRHRPKQGLAMQSSVVRTQVGAKFHEYALYARSTSPVSCPCKYCSGLNSPLV
ncbi:hypothetical protein L227DRAFT_176650 [Lentinus tigrinus ALCF2SS1-6]|uniref:Uncharacterized protein n=1 Tax=Lentinus tigrinus ALCF2SS1-6 TaxID=1328759 RepID=A0A5C2S6T9_9APHY|nr:hypothetical protein L227DRAFT_176650 [Lentinus tigrinus ALCF2SS1-6]